MCSDSCLLVSTFLFLLGVHGLITLDTSGSKDSNCPRLCTMGYNCFSNNIALEKEMLLGKHTTLPVQQLLPVCDKLEWVKKHTDCFYVLWAWNHIFRCFFYFQWNTRHCHTTLRFQVKQRLQQESRGTPTQSQSDGIIGLCLVTYSLS